MVFLTKNSTKMNLSGFIDAECCFICLKLYLVGGLNLFEKKNLVNLDHFPQGSG